MKAIPAFLVVTVLLAACSTNNVTVDDSLGRFFDSAGVKGCFALFDNGQGRFTIYNLPRYRDSAYPAGSTFDIPELLIGLQTGALQDDKFSVVDTNIVGVDSLMRPTHAPATITLTQGFQTSGMANSEVFLKLTQNIGMDTLKKFTDSLHYGNADLTGLLTDSFWMRGHVKISADQQLGLIKKLYFNQLPFYKRPHEIVRGLMKKESNANYQLVYKTAEIPNPDHTLGWVLGWVEENRHPYFFVLNLESADPKADLTIIGIQLIDHILPSLGFFQGKK